MTQKEATRMTVECIKKHQPCDVYISSYSAGKEELFVEVAKTFGTRIWVSKDRFRDLELLGLSQHFTLDDSQAFIFLNRFGKDEDDRDKDKQ